MRQHRWSNEGCDAREVSPSKKIDKETSLVDSFSRILMAQGVVLSSTKHCPLTLALLLRFPAAVHLVALQGQGSHMTTKAAGKLVGYIEKYGTTVFRMYETRCAKKIAQHELVCKGQWEELECDAIFTRLAGHCPV